MKQIEIIEKIRKLLALAQGSSAYESEAALGMANTLLLKHNISIRDVHGNVFGASQHPGFFEAKINMTNGLSPIEFWLASLVKDHFCVSTIINKPIGVSANSVPCSLLIIGEYHNVEIAVHIYNFLQRKFSELWANYKFESACDDADYESYISGLFFGLNQKLKDQQTSNFHGSKALVVMRKDLECFIKTKLSGSKPEGVSSEETAKYHKAVVENGKRDGSTINLFSAVSANSNDRKKVA